MVDFHPASNPWKKDLLQSSQPPRARTNDGEYTGEMTKDEAFKSISSFLNSWSGTATVDLDVEERHTRFVQIVGGYPLINNRFPLDWPLHPGSCKALRLSLFLDSIEVRKNTSLRTYILEKDFARRVKHKKSRDEKRKMEAKDLKGYLSEWRNLNTECVEVLIAALRGFVNLEDPLDAMEVSFLISLHSSDSDAISCWPPHNTKNKPLGYNLKLDQHFFLSRPERSRPELSDKELGKELKRLNKLELSTEHLLEHPNFDKNVKKFNRQEVNFELKYIQTWINDWLKHWLNSKVKDSIGQRFVRGLSVICESAMASIRQDVIDNFGVGSIVIDGGGRLSIAVPPDKAKDAEERMKKAYYKTFLNESSFLSQEINDAFFGHVAIEEREEAFKGKRMSELREKIHGPDFVKKNLPPFRCHQIIEGKPRPPPVLWAVDKNSCKLCNGIDDSSEEEQEKFWNRLTGSLKKSDETFCFMHRLAFFVGTNQRKRDSILRLSKTENIRFPVVIPEDSGSDINEQRRLLRRVEYVSMIDGNSLGYFFLHSRENIYLDSNPGHKIDVRRRRCFRFNSLWYISLSNALQEYLVDGSDRIAAWVCAGDDLVLAQYGGFTGEEPIIQKFLQSFDSELDKNFSETPLSITFAGSLVQRTDGGRINKMYNDAMTMQKVAKLEWKNRMKGLELEVDYLQTRTKPGEFEPKRFDTLDESHWCTQEGNVFPTMSSDDPIPRSLVRTKSCEDIEIKCHHCQEPYRIDDPKHSKDCTEKEKPRPLRVYKSETEWEDLPSYDKYLGN